MAVAFGAILIAARVEYRREGSLTAVFAGIYLDSTLRRIDRRDAERLSEVVDAIRSGDPVDPILGRFRQEGMSHEEADVLERSARELSRVDELFHLYVAPQLAASLERQPERARLGGEEREVSVLFADLSRHSCGEGGAGDPLGCRSPGRRSFQLATVPDRGEHGPGARRERRRRHPAQLHRDRGHHQPGGTTPGHGAAR
jgi:hypothetical protein